MNDQTRALVEKQVRRVRRRLFAQTVVQSLVLNWALALVVAAFWFLLRPFTFAGFGDTVRWAVPGMVLGLGTLAGLLLAWLRRPNLLASSLSLDEKFGLKERVTTLLMLSPAQLDSPAGQALLHDVSTHLAALEVSSGFPLRLSRQQVLIPLGAFALALLACVVDPMLSELKFGARTDAVEPRPSIDAKEIQQQLEKLKKDINKRKDEEPTKSEKLQELEKEFEKLINQPLDHKNEEKVRERISEMRKLEDKMKERMEGLNEKKEKIDHLKKQMDKLNLDKNAQLKDGPAKDFEDALKNGEFDKARNVLEKLVKDLKNNKLSKEKQKELAEQFEQLQDKLQKLLDDDEVMKQLKQDAKDGKISKEELQRELERFQDLQDVTDILGECRECLGKLEGKEASAKLEKILDRLREIELTEEEIRDLLRDQAEIDEATRLLLAQMAGQGMNGDGMQGGGLPGGKRNADPNDPNSKIKSQRQKAEVNPKGAQRFAGYAKGGNFNKVPAKEVQGKFQQADQEAPEALDRQGIRGDAADIVRSYFDKLGKQR